MYPLFYQEYLYSIKISVDEFLQRMDDDLILTSSNAYKHEKQGDYLPLTGEFNKNKNVITKIGLNEPPRGSTAAKINLNYNISGDYLEIKFSFRESFWLYLILIFLTLILTMIVLPFKGILIFMIIFFPLIILRCLYPYFSSVKTIIRTFEYYLFKHKIEFERISITKYSILDYIFKNVKNDNF